MRLETRILTRREVARALDLPTAIRVVRHATAAYAAGQATMPPKVYLPLPKQSDFRAMPAYLAHPPACGMKWVNVHPHNPRRGLPTVMAVVIINDPATGVPLAIMDGLLVTKLRTAATTAVATQALARRNSRLIGLVGCGAQGDTQLLALRHVLRYRHVKVWGAFPHEAERFCRRMRPQLPGVRLEPVGSLERCTRDVDVLLTVTPSRRPLIRRAWLKPGLHINAVGADAAGKQELDPRILQEATVVVDDRTQAIHAGEINVPIARGQYNPKRLHGTLGDVLLGRRRGRRSLEELTVFDSTGLAVHDVALGEAILQRARRLRLGRPVQLF
jgi:alanine dehydrogenase